MKEELINPVCFTREIPGLFNKFEHCLDSMDTFINLTTEVHEYALEEDMTDLDKTQSEVCTIIKTAIYDIADIQAKAIRDIKEITDDYNYVLE